MKLIEFLEQWKHIPMGLTTYLEFKKNFGESATMTSEVKSGLLVVTFTTENESSRVVIQGTDNVIFD